MFKFITKTSLLQFLLAWWRSKCPQLSNLIFNVDCFILDGSKLSLSVLKTLKQLLVQMSFILFSNSNTAAVGTIRGNLLIYARVNLVKRLSPLKLAIDHPRNRCPMSRGSRYWLINRRLTQQLLMMFVNGRNVLLLGIRSVETTCIVLFIYQNAFYCFHLALQFSIKILFPLFILLLLLIHWYPWHIINVAIWDNLLATIMLNVGMISFALMSSWIQIITSNCGISAIWSLRRLIMRLLGSCRLTYILRVRSLFLYM